MIYITRHGQTDWNVAKKVMGKHDEPLNEEGRKQAKIVRDKLKDTKLDLIVSSPLLRAKETALIINEQRNIPMIYDDRISERDFGEFEGQMTKDFDFLEFWDYYQNTKYQRAENIQSFFQRVYDGIEDICTEHGDKDILIVTHGGTSIPLYCFFKSEIPTGSFIEKDIVLENCEVASYQKIKK